MANSKLTSLTEGKNSDDGADGRDKKAPTAPSPIYDDYISVWMVEFLNDRRAQNLSPATVKFYHWELKLFLDYCDAQAVKLISQVTPGFIRQFLIKLAEDHNPGGVHCVFRSIRAFFNWWEVEAAPEGWKNPIKKVKAPKIGQEPLKPVMDDDIGKLIEACKGNDFFNLRDKAIFFALLDTGARAQELLSWDREDVNLVSGQVIIKRGKGRKPRVVFLGRVARKALRAYMARRTDTELPIWLSKEGNRLTYGGLREIFRRVSKEAGIKTPAIHSFRRAFALAMLRNGTDVFTLQKLMGHADLTILRRYLAQTDEDLRLAHAKNSPVDRLRK